MTTKNYIINFTDPAKPTITIPAGDSFGPESLTRLTDIELVGMGHTYWGEKFNENLLHILENFASGEDLHAIDSFPTAASFLVVGDVTRSFEDASTFEVINSFGDDGTYTVLSSTYTAPNTTVTITGNFPDGVTAPFGFAGAAGVPNKSADFSPITAITGQLWYNQNTKTIFVFNQTGSPLTAGVGDWKPLNNFSVSDTAPLGAAEGDFWWDSLVLDGRNLYVFISGTWEVVVPDLLPRDGSKPMAGVLDMSTNKITNLGNATTASDALNWTVADGRYVNVTGDTITGPVTINGVLDMQFNNITNVPTPGSSTDVMPRSYADNRYVNVTGDTMSGVLTMGANKITNIGNATNGSDALNLTVADGRYVNVTGDTMSGSLTLSAAPTIDLHAATKKYVDDNASASINAAPLPTVFSSNVVIISNYWQANTWTTISTGKANAKYVMVVADTYYIANSSGNTSMRVYARDPAQNGAAQSGWMFAYSGGNPAGAVYLTGSGTTIVATGGPTANPTIEVMATTNNGNIAPDVNYRIVAWW